MPSQNEKPFTVPTINVNLAPSTWSPVHGAQYSPVLIPCPIPRTVEMMVGLGECSPECREDRTRMTLDAAYHFDDCPARPIRVSCSIAGETWEGSEVKNINSTDALIMPSFFDAVWTACRERWALVKALVLGHTDLSALLVGPMAVDLLTQRDAVFAGIAGMVRNEEERIGLKQKMLVACPEIFPKSGLSVPTPAQRESAAYLAAYVERLMEKLGAMP